MGDNGIIPVEAGKVHEYPITTDKQASVIDLAGVWEFAFGTEGDFNDNINLPSTTEVSEKGCLAAPSAETKFLCRRRPYTGICRYKKDVIIPAEFEGKKIYLCLERTKYTRVFVDGQLVASSHETLIPQKHELSTWLTAGAHGIMVEVDNNLALYEDFPESLYNGHQYTEHTQTNWNGILGNITLEAFDTVIIENVVIKKCRDMNAFDIDLSVRNYCEEQQVKLCVLYGRLEAQAVKESGCESILEPGMNYLQLRISEEKLFLWNEFNPNLYQFQISIKGRACKAVYNTVTGFRDAAVLGQSIQINREAVFLRGNLDCCIYPLTGYAPMKTEDWIQIYRQAKEYGINHYRFHSWCPPKAAFEAADREGIYLQVELSCFANGFYKEDNSLCDRSLNEYLYDQSQKLLREFGNHPSFLIFAVGNEMIGDVEAFADLLKVLKKQRPDKLYTQGSNNFLEDPVCTGEDDLWITMRTAKTDNVRASFSHGDKPLGHLQLGESYHTLGDYKTAVSNSVIPVISHEVGQYQASPNFKEAEKYRGITASTALKVFWDRLKEKKLEKQWEEFYFNSGDLLVQCYKEEMEALLRTDNLSGFQLLGLQDFPGQGTALVGIWDSFLDTKGFIRPEQWREFCNSRVVLFKMEKGIYKSGEAIEGEVWVHNYGEEAITDGTLVVTIYKHRSNTNDFGKEMSTLKGEGHKTYYSEMERSAEDEILGVMSCNNVRALKGSLSLIQKVSIQLKELENPSALYMELNLGGIKNHYPLWVYPDISLSEEEGSLLFPAYSKEAEEALKQGKTIGVFSSKWENSIEGFFPTDFWCYPMFKKACEDKGLDIAPGTLGLICKKDHPALKHFPTQSCSGWQWRQIVNLSRPVVLDEDNAAGETIVQVIDNFDRNHKLGLIYEIPLYTGKMVVCAADLFDHLHIPEVKQLFYSLKMYIEKESFKEQ